MKNYLNAFQPESPADAARLFLVAAVLFLTPFLWESGLWMPDRFWIDAAVFACAALLFADSSHNRLNPRLFAAMIVFIAVYWVTSLISNVPALSAIQLRLVVVGSVWALAIAVGGERWRLRLAVLLSALVGCLLLSQCLEFLGAFYHFGWGAFGIQAAGRVSNPNLLCALLLGTLPWTMVLWREGGEWGRRFSWGLWIGALISFVIAGSRTGMVAVVITGGVAVLLLGKRYRRILLGGAGIFFAAASLFYLPRFLSLFNPEHITNVQRLHMMRAGLIMGGEHPFVGWGPGTIGEVYPLFQTFDKWELHLHCLPLQVWAETGLMGIAAWSLLLVAAGVAAFKKREDAAQCAAALSIVGMLACQLTDYLFWIPAAFLLFWVNLGVLMGWGNGRSEGFHKGVRVLAPVLIGVVAIVMILLPELGLRELQAGDSAMAREDWEGAVEHCRRAEQLLGDHPLPPLLEGVARLRMTEGKSEEAFLLLQTARERDPLCAGTLNLMGWSLVERGFLDEAAAIFEKAWAMDPRNDWGPSALDLAYVLSLKEDEESARVLEESAKIYPNLTRYVTAEVFEDPELWKEIKPQEELDPFYTQDLLYGTQSRYSWSGSYFERTEEELREAVAANPLHYPIRTALAERLIEAGRTEEALEQSTEALELCRRQYAADPHLLFIHGLALKQLGQREESDRFMRAAVSAGKAVAQPARNLLSLNYRLRLAAPQNSDLWPHPGRW